MNKPTFKEIVDRHPLAAYVLNFRRETVKRATGADVLADIDKKWFKFCPDYEVSVDYDDGVLRLETITAYFYRPERR